MKSHLLTLLSPPLHLFTLITKNAAQLPIGFGVKQTKKKTT